MTYDKILGVRIGIWTASSYTESTDDADFRYLCLETMVSLDSIEKCVVPLQRIEQDVFFFNEKLWDQET